MEHFIVSDADLFALTGDNRTNQGKDRGSSRDELGQSKRGKRVRSGKGTGFFCCDAAGFAR